MTAAALELAACHRRTRWSLAGSFTAHVLLLLLLILMPHAMPQAPSLTEFTMIDPGELDALSNRPTASAPASATDVGALAAETRDVNFERAPTNADIEPNPQSENAIADRLASRLATLQSAEAVRVTGVAEARMHGTPGAGVAPASVAGGAGMGTAVHLNRGGGVGTAPSLVLSRGGGGTSRTAAPVAVQPPPSKSASAAPATAGESNARRTLSGMSLAGPIANRPVTSYRKPVYPDWAKRELVEGSVTLYFIVRPDGSVKENILVQRTAGFEDFDENARSALRAWVFAPLGGGRTGEQWGTITFHFRLQEAG